MSLHAHLTSGSAEETLRIAAAMAERLAPGDALLLSGELGAGKTTFTQGVALGLGVRERPRSPTFVMACEYRGRLPLYHLDLYRVDDLGELDELGLDEYLIGEGVTVVEWADRAPSVFPQHAVWVALEETDAGARRITIACDTPRNAALAAWLRDAAGSA